MGVAALMMSSCGSEPVKSADPAWRALGEAERVGAAEYAPELWLSAQQLYDSGWTVFTAQKGRVPGFRHYDVAESLWAKAERTAETAADSALEAHARHRARQERRLSELTNALATYETIAEEHLSRMRLRRPLVQATLNLENAQRLIEQMAEARAIDDALVRADASISALAATIDGHAPDPSDLTASRHAIERTVAWSARTDSAAMIVVKESRTAYLLHRGRMIAQYPVELGYRPERQKARAGDGATPEGEYRVTMWRNKGSKYYKALMLDYPNERDRVRFASSKRNGDVPRHVGIGGNIEIHGEGGRGKDWTEGCVALRNDDMDEVMKRMKVGCWVTIVRHVGEWPL
jgi:L,D-peptidoglycan transpeptidase YkuD (ErfK/YbiS/YcfS/YnhG family)